jgi:hypothetical protein
MPPFAASALSAVSDSTAPVFSLSTGVMPFNSMHGVVSYLVAPSTSTAVSHASVIVCGEFVAVRVEGDVRKAYSYAYGIASTGGTVFKGPFKDFPHHHTPSSRSVSAASLVGFNPHLRAGGSD